MTPKPTLAEALVSPEVDALLALLKDPEMGFSQFARSAPWSAQRAAKARERFHACGLVKLTEHPAGQVVRGKLKLTLLGREVAELLTRAAALTKAKAP